MTTNSLPFDLLAMLQGPLADEYINFYQNLPPLHQAAFQGKENIVTKLLKDGTSVDSSYEGNTALNFAATAGQERVAELLLRKGAQLMLQVRTDAHHCIKQ